MSIKIVSLNEHITCKICNGYLIDATTIVKCLHSFCKTCLVKHLSLNNNCPKCKIEIQKSNVFSKIRCDSILQDIVYKLVPGLYKNEMNRRSNFYEQHPEELINASTSEQKGKLKGGERIIWSPDDIIDISIEYLPEIISYSYLPLSSVTNPQKTKNESYFQRRYLRCEGGMKVAHLKKWIKLKYELPINHKVEIMLKHELLRDNYTMMDLAYISFCKKPGPLTLYYKFSDNPVKKGIKRKKSSNKKKDGKLKKRYLNNKNKHINRLLNNLTNNDLKSCESVIQKEMLSFTNNSSNGSSSSNTEFNHVNVNNTFDSCIDNDNSLSIKKLELERLKNSKKFNDCDNTSHCADEKNNFENKDLDDSWGELEIVMVDSPNTTNESKNGGEMQSEINSIINNSEC